MTAHRMLEDSRWSLRIGGRMDAHIAWHQAVYALQIGRNFEAVTIFDRELASADDASTCADATDLLWRLDLAGAAAGARWQALAAAWARHLVPGFMRVRAGSCASHCLYSAAACHTRELLELTLAAAEQRSGGESLVAAAA